ncbi:hypothetical protein NOS3756_50950 [Nostoc sp. NIES-3756]|uniref:hypothetical protein n=1 Tax=Nostoc sp. NIES-3756 TaxID=1751286 RepID=UPI00071F1ECE|nr:hypothetical protein [Nostoc sp. NIES-3756]BAT56093.1 hypothetical protein NOS3756_50950 [Nostoc sp. NIES-3756]
MQEQENNRLNKYQALKEQLVNAGVSREIFSLTQLQEPTANEQALREKKSFKNPTRLLYGHFFIYAERFLKVSSKKALEETHAIFARQSINYWCKQCGIEPTLGRTLKGGKKQSESRLQYEGTTVLSLEKAAKLLCYLFRFKLEGGGAKTSLEEYEDVATCALLDLLDRTIPENIALLKDIYLGEQAEEETSTHSGEKVGKRSRNNKP